MALRELEHYDTDAKNKKNVVQAVEAVNAPPEFMGGRQLIAKRKAVAPHDLRDMSVSMKALLA